MDILKLSTDLQSNLIKKLSPESTLRDMLNIIVGRVAEVLETSASTIFLIDEEDGTATQRAGTGYQRQFIDKAQCQVVPTDKVPDKPESHQKLGLTGWILSTGWYCSIRGGRK